VGDGPSGPPSGWRARLYVVVFEADTPAGKAFDVALMVAIVAGVVAVMLESVPSIRANHSASLRAAEWALTGLFTAEYLLRIAVVARPTRYMGSFFGIADLLAILPTYMSVVFPGSQSLVTIRALRLLRIFRVFKLGRFLGQANLLLTALRSSARKVIVFLGTILILVLILGSAMYLIEGEAAGFTSIPTSVYWAIVTMTTVGYGDIAPLTPVGKTLAAAAMILGYSIIAVPTGIITAELVQGSRRPNAPICPACLSASHDSDARFCKHCGSGLEAPNAPSTAAG